MIADAGLTSRSALGFHSDTACVTDFCYLIDLNFSHRDLISFNLHTSPQFRPCPRYPSQQTLTGFRPPRTMSESNAEYLESFREQWRREVSARSGNDSTRQDKPSTTYSSRLQQKPPRSRPGKASERVEKADEQESHSQYHFDDDQIAKDTQANSEGKKAESGVESQPQSALEHYEKAVERESQGSLGDSLHLYRKAFKVSRHSVDQQLVLTKCRWMIG